MELHRLMQGRAGSQQVLMVEAKHSDGDNLAELLAVVFCAHQTRMLRMALRLVEEHYPDGQLHVLVSTATQVRESTPQRTRSLSVWRMSSRRRAGGGTNSRRWMSPK